MAVLHLVEGPAGGGKSQYVAELVAAGTVAIVADVTRLWAAVGGYERGPDGRYPVREDDDPALHTARYLQAVAVRHALEQGADVAVTTSQPGQAARWRHVSTRYTLEVTTVDPGEEVVRQRLELPETGELSPECQRAIDRWFHD